MSIGFDLGTFVEKTFDSFKKITPFLVSLLIVSSIILFVPENLRKKIHIDELGGLVLKVIGIVFITSLSLVLVILLFDLVKVIISKLHIFELEKNMLLLTPKEKNIVLIMLHSEGHCLSLKYEDGITGVLISKEIIFRVSNVSDGVGHLTFQYSLQPWVIRYCCRNKEFDSVPFTELEKIRKEHYRNISFFG